MVTFLARPPLAHFANTKTGAGVVHCLRSETPQQAVEEKGKVSVAVGGQGRLRDWPVSVLLEGGGWIRGVGIGCDEGGFVGVALKGVGFEREDGDDEWDYDECTELVRGVNSMYRQPSSPCTTRGRSQRVGGSGR